MKTTEARKRANAKYDKANTIRYSIKLNKNTDAALIKKLAETNNKQGLIKKLLRAHFNV